MKNGLTEADYQEAAKLLGCEPAAIKAVAEVESSGSGFLATGEPKILFERHYFRRLTGNRFDKLYPDLSGPYKAGTYGPGGQHQHRRLQAAISLDRNAALQSASWGRFQIMGENYQLAGFKSIQSFINAMYNSERDHLLAFSNFVINKGLAGDIRNKDWARFARGYNGPAYAQNKYDIKMAAAYKKYSK